MNQNADIHPPLDQLVAFAGGKLSADAQTDLEQHISQCDLCCSRLQSMPDDTLMAQLRDVDTSVDAAVAPSGTRVESVPASDASDAIPAALVDHPRYRVIRKLGAGGMGEVYQAEHRMMERSVAIKVINRAIVSNPKALERFRLEVRAAGKLAHRNIVTAHDADSAGDLHFLVMEFVPGRSLDAVVAKRGPLPIVNACNYIRQAALGLEHAASVGMVHRDIKPQNLMLATNPKGIVKILDFGLARLAAEQTESFSELTDESVDARGLTTAGATLGTPDYMAPEQIQDASKADIRADIYSLGCTLYYLLTGQPPFQAESLVGKISAHLNSKPLSVSAQRIDMPPKLQGILERMMAKRVEDRFQSPREVADALLPFAGSDSKSVSPTPTTSQLPDIATPPAQIDPLEQALAGAPLDVATTALPALGSPKQKATSIVGDRKMMMPLAVVGGILATIVLCGLAYWQWPTGDKHSNGDTSGNVVREPATHRPNISTHNARGYRILMVVPFENFYRADYANVIGNLAGHTVHVASSRLGNATDSVGKPLQVDVELSRADASDYDTVIFIGVEQGSRNEFAGGRMSTVKKFVAEMQAKEKYVSSICGGNEVLARAGFLRGNEAARCPFLNDPSLEELAHWKNRKVVTDEKIVTGSEFGEAAAFVDELLKRLRQ